MEKKYIDLHCHSTYSDGAYSIDELILIAKKLGVKTLAITDHDDIRSVYNVKSLLHSEIEFISGVELSTVYKTDNGKERYIHILGYDFDEKNPELKTIISHYYNNRLANNLTFLETIEKEGIIVPDHIKNRVRFENYNRIDVEIADAFLNSGYSKQYVDEFLIKVQPFIPEYKNYELETLYIIGAIKRAGGIPVIAHANKINFSVNELIAFVNEAKKHGLMGMETMYAEFSDAENKTNQRIAQHFGLLESVGSDFHIFDEDQKALGLGINGNLRQTSCSLLTFIKNRRKKIINTSDINKEKE